MTHDEPTLVWLLTRRDLLTLIDGYRQLQEDAKTRGDTVLARELRERWRTLEDVGFEAGVLQGETDERHHLG